MHSIRLSKIYAIGKSTRNMPWIQFFPNYLPDTTMKIGLFGSVALLCHAKWRFQNPQITIFWRFCMLWLRGIQRNVARCALLGPCFPSPGSWKWTAAYATLRSLKISNYLKIIKKNFLSGAKPFCWAIKSDGLGGFDPFLGKLQSSGI